MIKVLYDEWLQRYNVLILGGFFSVREDTPSPDYDYGNHAITFTMCHDQINICTWGSCEVDKPHGHTDSPSVCFPQHVGNAHLMMFLS